MTQERKTRSNEITLNSSKHHDLFDTFIAEERRISDDPYLANLSDLAKVILIEHKRSLQFTHSTITTTEDSSVISFTPPPSESRRESFSSRQDSSLSANGDMNTSMSSSSTRQHSLDHRRTSLRNADEWQKRRKELMKKTKKWSIAVDETTAAAATTVTTTDEDNSTTQAVVEKTMDESLLLDNNEEIKEIKEVEESVKKPLTPPNEIALSGDMISVKTINKLTNEVHHQSSISINMYEASSISRQQFAIKPVASDENVSVSVGDIQSHRPTRKLPKIPNSNANI